MNPAYLSFKQYEYAAREITEVGRLLGGWMRKTRQSLGRDHLLFQPLCSLPEGHQGQADSLHLRRKLLNEAWF